MTFKNALESNETQVILANGPLGTRLKYDYKLSTVFDISKNNTGREALKKLYSDDIAIVQAHKLAMVLNAPTYRASIDHLKHTGLTDVKKINQAYLQLAKEIQEKYSTIQKPIFVGAPIGSRFDPYAQEENPSIEASEQYHQEQIDIFKSTGVDFINAVTIPKLNEALGIAKAADKSEADYTIGFLLNKNATLLDGITIEHAIETIDKKTKNKPIGYLLTCTHTSVIETLIKKLSRCSDVFKRLIGIQPNGSNLSLEELNTSKDAKADEPQIFAENIKNIKKELPHIKFIAGCCGTTTAHLQAIAEMYRK